MNDDAQLPRTTRVAAYAIARDERRRILLVRIAPGYAAVGMWTLPGGGLNFAEEPAEGAIRELREETGLTGTVKRLALVTSWARQEPANGFGPHHAIQIVYEVAITGGQLRHEQDESTDMAAWFSLEEVHSLTIVPLVEVALGWLASSTGLSSDQ